jgi:hypothetical protein
VDDTPPELSSVSASGDPRKIQVVFNEAVTQATAGNIANYGVSGVTITGATLGADNRTVTLTTGADLSESVSYTLTVNNVTDVSGNPIAGNSQMGFDYTAILLSDGLVAYWNLDENSGSVANDLSGNNHTGTVSGAQWAPGMYNSGLDFGGGTDHVDVGNIDVVAGGTGNDGLTLAFWFQANSFGVSDARLISKSTSANEQDHYWMVSTISDNGTKLRMRLKAGGTTTTLIAGSGNLTAGEWYHAVATYDGSNMRLYLEKQEVGSVAKTGTIDVSSSVSVWLGNNPGTSNQGFDGLMDDIRIYDRALTPAEITILYDNGGSTGTETLPGRVLAFNAYPNPFRPAVTITLPGQGSGARVSIYTVNGKCVRQYRDIKAGKVVWNAGGLASGVYILKAETNGKRFMKRIMLQK